MNQCCYGGPKNLWLHNIKTPYNWKAADCNLLEATINLSTAQWSGTNTLTSEVTMNYKAACHYQNLRQRGQQHVEL